MISATLRHMLEKLAINFKFLVLSLLWAGVIYYLSSIPDLKSDFGGLIDLILRKGAHIFVYFVLSCLLSKTLDQSARSYTVWVFWLGVLYAVSDEWHQSSVAHRSGNSLDVFIDTVGVVGGLIAYRWFYRQK